MTCNKISYLSRRAVSISLILGLIFSSLSFTTLTQAVGEDSGKWDYVIDGIYQYVDFSPFSEEKDDYEIQSAAQLAAVSVMVNQYGRRGNKVVLTDKQGNSASSTDFEDKNLTLVNNIDIGEYEWVPIGGVDVGKGLYGSFKGHFYGECHKIENMRIGSENNFAEYQLAGLFGYVKSTDEVWITDLGLENCKIYNKGNYTGALIGWLWCSSFNSATIANCYSTGIVSSDNTTGGLIGYMYSNRIDFDDEGDRVNIYNCYSRANVTGSKYVGGIIGEIDIHEYNRGKVINLLLCYSSGNITNTSGGATGGLIGIVQQTWDNVLAKTTLSLDNVELVVCFYKEGTAEMAVGSIPKADGTYVKALGKDFMTGPDMTNAFNAYVYQLETQGELDYLCNWIQGDEGYPVFDWINDEPDQPAAEYWVEIADTSWYNPEANEYDISTAAQLAGLAKLVNDGTTNFESKTIKLTANINLEEHEWVPIGIGEISFCGNFDGQGHEITNMKIGSEQNPANYQYTGLFGYVMDRENSPSIIANVGVTGNIFVEGYSEVGGVVGKLYSSYSLAEVTNSYSLVNISHQGAKSYVGGIVGVSFSNMVIRTDTHVSYTGKARVINCYNMGSIDANKCGVGGIVGQANQYYGYNEIRNCYNARNVTVKGGIVGGVVGYNEYGRATISDTYYLNTVAERGIGNVNKKEEERLKQTIALSEEQMKAATGTEGALVDRLNAWVDQNRTENPELNSWVQNNEVNNAYPYFGDVVNLLEGWQTIGEQTYYYINGEAQNDWQKIEGEWYYFYEDTKENRAAGRVGQVAKNMWEKGHDGYWYYVGPDGRELKGWLNFPNNISYYLGEDGKMRTNWQEIEGEWYYFYEYTEANRQTGRIGQLARNMWEKGHNSYWYYVDENGKMAKNRWCQNGADWYYVGPDGKICRNTWITNNDGRRYYLGTDGKMVNNFIGQPNGNGSYNYHYNGSLLQGWSQLGSSYYYFFNGQMIFNAVVDGHQIGADGRMIA